MKRLVMITLVLVLLTLVLNSATYAQEDNCSQDIVIDDDTMTYDDYMLLLGECGYNFIELSFDNYELVGEVGYLSLDIIGSYSAVITFKYYFTEDELCYYDSSDTVYHYDIVNDILIVVYQNEIIFNDLDL